MLEAGTILAHYRLAEKIGEGGMGEVWRATDTRLDRDVAVKILPERLTLDPNRLDRFTREAKLLASLNHPGIATIHDVDESHGVRFLVMELVPGHDLAEELERGPLPVREALEVALNIAKAIEAAHGQGVVHRDLKPANVKRSAGSDVKVLDFGLAKAMEPDPTSGERDESVSPTVTSAGTLAGVILGTAAYMSPEQARGRPIDKRTDVWSFGVLLYELLTGDNPFRGDTVADSVGAIMHRDPDLDSLPADTPAAVRRLLRRCLTRERAHRLHDIADVRIELEEALADPDAEIDATAIPASAAAIPARTSKLPWIALAVLLPIVAALGWLVVTGDEDVAPEAPRRFKLAHDVEVRSAVVSPDGTRIAYIVEDELFLRSLDSLEPRQVAVDIGAQAKLFWSPDGRSLGVIKRPTQLLRVDLDGGAPVVLTDAAEFLSMAAWSDDGHIYYARFQGGITRVPEGGGAPEEILPGPDRLIDYHGLAILPQGRGFLTIPHLLDDEPRAIYLEAPGEEPRSLFASDSTINHVWYSPTGHVVFHRQENPVGLWAIPFSLDAMQTTGEPFLVVPELAVASFSESGDLIYPQSALQGTRRKQALVWLDRTGREVRRLDMALYGAFDPELSPDGSKVALIAVGVGRPSTDPPGVWVIDLDRRNGTRVSTERIVTSTPIWNADGTRVAYIEARMSEEGKKNVVSVRADGSGDRQVLLTSKVDFYLALSRDWSFAAFMHGSLKDDNGMSIATQRPDDPASFATFVDTPEHEVAPAIHPDGNWIAYMSGTIPSMAAVVRPFPDGDGQWKVSPARVWSVDWSSDGTKLYYLEREADAVSGGEVFEITFDGSGPVPSFGAPQRLFSVPTDDIQLNADDHFLAIQEEEPAEGEEAPDVHGIVVVENWAG